MNHLPKNPMNIGVVVGLDLVGDALIKLPFLKALRFAFPEAKIHWITSKGATAYNSSLREITKDLIDEIHETPEWLLSEKYSAPFFDILIDTRNKWREASSLRRSIPNHLFIAMALHGLLSSPRSYLFLKQPSHLVERLIKLAELAAGKKLPLIKGNIKIPVDLIEKTNTLLPEGKIYIGIAPGAGNPIKIWPLENFIALAKEQAQKGRIPVFILGPMEEKWLETIKKEVPESIFPLQQRGIWGTEVITVMQTMAIGKFLNLAIANDSGTGHMLAAVDCPLISLFGPTSPEKLAPIVTRGKIIYARDFGGKEMRLIPMKIVSDAVETMLG